MTVDKGGKITDLVQIMSAIAQLTDLAQGYLAATDVEISTLSWRVFSDTKKLGAIMDGGADLHTRRFEKAVQWFSDNWPEAATWPQTVQRPPNSGEAAA